MKECPVCHSQYDDNVNFCRVDGQKLVAVQPQPKPEVKAAPVKECPKCHKQYDMSKNFCLADGTPLVVVQPKVEPKPEPKVEAKPEPKAEVKAVSVKECPKCHKQYDMSKNFCLADGTPLVVVQPKAEPAPQPKAEAKPAVAAAPVKECPKCHKQYDISKNFCLADGTPLVEVQPKVEPAPQPKAEAKPAVAAAPVKECPKCHKQYDMSKNFCLADGTPLVVVQPEPQPASQPKPQPVAPQPKPQPAPQPKPQPAPQPKPQAPKPPKPQAVAPQPKPQAPKPPKAPMSKKAKMWIWITVAVVVVAGALVGGYIYMKNATTYLRISPTQVTIGKDGGTATVAIDYDGYLWDVDVSPEWTETEKDGDVLKITVAPNTSNSSRAGAISLKSGDHVASVQLSQSAYVTFITPSVKSLKFGRAAETKTFVISTDGTNATFTTPDFITCERRGDTVTVKAAANSGDSRDGFILIREDNIRAEVLVEQLGACAACHGEGKIVCTSCNGTGIFRYGRTKVSCAGCSGTGKRDCSECGGAGEI